MTRRKNEMSEGGIHYEKWRKRKKKKKKKKKKEKEEKKIQARCRVTTKWRKNENKVIENG
jgi:hypothetical protein